MAKVNEKLTDFIKEISPIIEKHKPLGIIVVVGMENKGDDMDEAVVNEGTAKYLTELLAKTIATDPKISALVEHAFMINLLHKALHHAPMAKKGKRVD